MREFGLIGFPLGHSFSKPFFTEKFAREGLDACYLNFEIPRIEMLLDVIKEHPALEGLNCTIPHKEAVLPLLDSISPEAQEIGAVNVLRIRRGKGISPMHPERDFHISGYNSDIIGFRDSISPLLAPHHKKALILGTGGAAKAIIVALRGLGLEYTFVSRSPGNGKLAYGELSEETMKEYQVIVNCTPVGMFPHTDECPPLPYGVLGPQHLLYDLIYNPEQTLFLREGAKAGAVTKNGMDMLRMQALASWEIWTK